MRSFQEKAKSCMSSILKKSCFEETLIKENHMQTPCTLPKLKKRAKPLTLFLKLVSHMIILESLDMILYCIVVLFFIGVRQYLLHCREKDIDTRDFLEAAKTCLQICRRHDVPFLINDRIDIALACDADGVHIGQSDMPARVARTLLGPDKVLGVSCKTPEQAAKAWIDGADYIGCGGVYPTNTKENNITIGLDGLTRVCLASKLPVVAIGGIGVSNARSVMELGVPNLKGVAVVSAVFDRECILSETQKLRRVVMDSVGAVE